MSIDSNEFPQKVDFETASIRIEPYVHKTPVLSSRLIDSKAGAALFFKCENFQRMGAFKMRGATNAILQLTKEEKARGVATHSSGNFAQGVALAAQELNVPATIVMPSNAPAVKKAAVLDYAAKVVDCEPTLKAREATLASVVEAEGLYPLHPYDQWEVLVGQGTSAMELMNEQPDLDCILTPVGGGGLLGGTALACHYFHPNVTVYGAEPEGADDAKRSLEGGKWVPQDNPQTIADGLRTSLGKKGFAVIQQHVPHIFSVSEEEIVSAMQLVWERMKLIIEPSSAVPLAAVLKHKEKFANQKVGIIVSGGNVDLKKLPFG